MSNKDFKPAQEPLAFIVVQGILLCSALVTNLASLAYVRLKLKLNTYLLKILTFHLSVVVIAITTAMIGYTLLFIYDIRNLYTCTLYPLPSFASFDSAYLFSAAISVIRYHMAIRMANQQFFQLWFVILVIGIAGLLTLLVFLAMFVPPFFFSQPFGPVIEACYKPSDNLSDDLIFGPAFALFTSGFGMVVGIVFDLKMACFLKHRQTVVQPAIALVSWDQHQPPLISPGSNDNSYKLTIPIQATCLGIVNLCFLTAFVCAFLFGLGKAEYVTYFLHSGGVFCIVIHMPLVLLLTVKTNQKRMSQPKAPGPVLQLNQLHFHGDSNPSEQLSKADDNI